MAYEQARALRRVEDPHVILMIFGFVAAAMLALALIIDPIASIVVVISVVVLAVVTVQPRMALHVTVLFVALSDLHLSDPATTDSFRLVQTLVAYGIPFSPLEIVLAFAAIGLAIRLLFDDATDLTTGELFSPVALLMVTVLLGVAWGAAHGADFRAMRAETRGLFYLPLLYLIGTHFVRTPEHVMKLMWTFVIAVNAMSIESVYRYFTHVRPGYDLAVHPDLAFGHENAVFCSAAIILLLARILWSKNAFAEWKSIALMALPMCALLVMKRRTGMVALEASILLLCVVLLRDSVRLFLIAVPIAILGAGLLLALTWTAPGGKGQFARSFQTVTGTEQTARDKSSDDYRAIETVNIRQNIKSSPVTGLGFGRKYSFYQPLPNLSGFWPLWAFVPHNTIFWFWMKAGVLGFVAMLSLFACAMTKSLQLVQVLPGDALKPIAFSLGAMVLMFVLFSYGDLGLVSPRALPFLGFVLGTLGAVQVMVSKRGTVQGEATAV